ncbi:LptF/LptG family permease [Sphingomonas sp.]|uniref:LptF/LptG family permease n=1 Tax=Sphingomonas sp. TaxID=28214 RepID=UPI0025F38007|nr:LptF/LptG family permease [Sphingomonas sp.]
MVKGWRNWPIAVEEWQISYFLSATDRYLARLIIVPLLSSLIVAAMLLVLDRMLRLFDFVASEGGPVSVVWKMLANLLPEYLSLGIPIGVMLGILLAFRKIALSSELDVLLAVGQSYWRLLRVPFMFAAFFALLNLAILGFVQPYTRYAYEGLRFELRSGALGASIKVGEFTRLGKNMTLRIEKSADQGRQLSGIFVMARQSDGKSLAVTAQTGRFLATDDPDVIILRLGSGTLINNAPGFKTPRVLTFAAHDLPIDLPKIESFRGRGQGQRELTLPELIRIGRSPKATPIVVAEMRSQFHFRLVQVVVMLFLPILAIALAVPPKRSTSAIGVFLSIVMLVAYYKINEYAEGMGSLGLVNPVAAIWVPFALFIALVGWMFYTLAYVPGGQPIGGIDRIFGKLFEGVKALFARIVKRPR